MRILLITDSYPPEIRSASHLMYELANELNSRGHKVVVVTSWPEYNLSSDQQTENFSESMVQDGVQVIRCRSLPHHNVNFILRGIAQLTLPRIYRRALLRHHSDDFDVTLVYSPPLTLASLGITMKRRAGIPFILNVQDVFPQNAIDLGVLRNPLLVAMFRWMERRAYRRAEKILVHSEGNRKFLATQFPDRSHKLNVLHNWTDLERFEEPTNAIDFRQVLNLDDRLVFMFAGVMGPSQKLEMIIDAARRQSNNLPDVLFLLVGDGTERQKLENRARGLSNVRFHAFVSRDDYPALVTASDVGLVSLSSANHTPVVPGKILDYMAGSLPVLGLLNRESDGHALIREAKCGYTAPSDDPAAIDAAIIKTYESRKTLQDLGRNGRRYARENFSKQRTVDQLLKLIAR